MDIEKLKKFIIKKVEFINEKVAHTPNSMHLSPYYEGQLALINELLKFLNNDKAK